MLPERDRYATSTRAATSTSTQPVSGHTDLVLATVSRLLAARQLLRSLDSRTLVRASAQASSQ